MLFEWSPDCTGYIFVPLSILVLYRPAVLWNACTAPVKHKNSRVVNCVWSLNSQPGYSCNKVTSMTSVCISFHLFSQRVTSQSLASRRVTVCLCVCLLPRLQQSPQKEHLHILSQEGAMLRPQRGAKVVQGQWRCNTPAAQSDRSNAAICNGILPLQLQPCYQWPSKLAAAGLRPAHQCIALPASSGC